MVLNLVEVTHAVNTDTQTPCRQHILVSMQTSAWENCITFCMVAYTVPGKFANMLSGLLHFNRD